MKRISRRTFIYGTGASTAILKFGMMPSFAQTLPAHEQALYQAAKAEGEVVWYSGHVSAEPAEAVGKAFTARYPGIKVTVLRASSQVLFQRVSQDLRANTPQCDVFSSVDHAHYALLKSEGNLLKYKPINSDGMVLTAGGAAEDFYHTTSVVLFLMAYNNKRVPDADAPKAWSEVVNQKWMNQIAIGHPGYSGGVATFVVALKKKYGMDFFKQLEKTKPHIGRSADDPVTVLNAGERGIGLSVATNTTLLSMSRGNPLKMVYPTDGVLALYSPSGIPRNAPHPNASKLFMEYMMGDDYASTVRPFFIHSLRKGAPAPEGALPLDKMSLMSPTPAEIEAEVPVVKEMWRDIFGV